jgi:hypothetical protein
MGHFIKRPSEGMILARPSQKLNMSPYFKRVGKQLKPFHVLYAIFMLIIAIGIIYRLLS